jgi:hypothetical protein
MDHGLSPTDMHKDGFNPLHRACFGSEPRHTETVKVFMEAGVNAKLSRTGDGRGCKQLTRNPGTRRLLKTFKKKRTPATPAAHAADEL